MAVAQAFIRRRPRQPQAQTSCTGDTKERELLKCVVAAMYSWQHCGTGTLSYKQPCHPVNMEQWNGQQRTLAIKMFDTINDSLEGEQREFRPPRSPDLSVCDFFLVGLP